MAQMKNTQYEQALKLMATSDAHAVVHYCFALMHDEVKEARKQQMFEAAEERMAQMKNTQYEQALKLMATSDADAVVHYCFALLREEVTEARKQQMFEAAEERLARMKNTQYEQALKLMATSD